MVKPASPPSSSGALPAPFIAKHNQGGKGLGVALFDSVDAFTEHLNSPGYEPPVDGIALFQEYLRAAQPRITRVEIVDGDVVYAPTADTARGGFELCPADACAVPAVPADGCLVTYDTNTNTNYNPEVEAAAPRSGPRQIARMVRRLIEEGEAR
ncbi:hypothetical protein GCM10023075_36420 [Streptosporangium album]